MDKKREMWRQITHLSGIVLIAIALFLGNDLTGILSIIFAVFLFFLSVYVKIKNKIRKNLPNEIRIKKLEEIEDSFLNFVNSMERERSEKNYMGAVLFFISSGISLLIFPKTISFIAISVLAVGDSFSTIIGIHFGKHITKINPPKTYEGTFGGLLASFFACLVFTNPLVALVASSVGMFIEVMPIRINDNILIPIIVGFTLMGLVALGISI
ncbi:MAG: phosphatidate cytidylyltransferase [Candidatus Aenigmarchaeota archaeon]|nr:phosphatidate cytidylyltransferase [Candidatus Aenigmarchaeota archaeon]